MPQEFDMDYHFGGPQKVLLYTEQEMALGLGLTRKKLVEKMEAGVGLVYHAHPASSGQYLFTEEAYQRNIRLWACLTSDDGHHMQFDRYYDRTQNKEVYRCLKCGAESYDQPFSHGEGR